MAVTSTLGALDRGALRAGALTAAVIAVPAGLVSQLLADRDRGGAWVGVLGAVALAGLVMGASVAARRQRHGTPLTHGIVTATGVFAAVQAVGVVRRSIAGDDITWSRVATSLLLSLLAGALGGLLGSRLSQGEQP